MKKLFKKQMKMISSLKTRKGRRETGLIPAEGFKTVQELYDSNYEKHSIILDIGMDAEKKMNILKKYKDIDIYEGYTDQISGMKNSEGIIGIGIRPDDPVPEKFFRNKKRIICLSDISDPGNLGTLIRTSLWFGVHGIILTGNCSDHLSPKVIRSSMGSIFHIDILTVNELEDIYSEINDFNITGTFLDEPHSFNKNYDKEILILGNEANGIEKRYKKMITDNYRIYPKGDFESLNVAVAGGIIMFDIFN